MMKILLTGGNGMLGRTIAKVFSKHPQFTVVLTDLPTVDITDENAIDSVIADEKPDVVIHCAAATNVDWCESHIDDAYNVNAFGSGNVASACYRHGIRLIAISTDYVFDGTSSKPYTEFDKPTDCNNIYGKSKFAGEEMIRLLCPNHCICRVSWLYGFGGPSFVHTMLKLADSESVVKVVDDQIGNPTSAIAVAEHLALLLDRPKLCGTFHLTCEGEATWAEFAREIFRIAGKDVVVEGCSTEEFPRLAARPKNSRLEKMHLRLACLHPMPDWKEALKLFMKEEFGYGS